MVEDVTRGEQLFGKTHESAPVSGGKSSFNEKLVKVFLNIRDLIVNLKAKTPPGEVKKAPVPASLAFSAQSLDLKFVNRVLIYILAGLVIATIYVFLQKRPDSSSVMAAVSKIKLQKLEDKAIVGFQPIDTYLQQVNTRNIFSEFNIVRDDLKGAFLAL